MPSYTGNVTVSDMIQNTRRILLSGMREERNRLSANMSGLTQSAIMTYAMGSIKQGARLSIGLEDLYVWSVSSQTATCQRADNNSVLEEHLLGATVYVNPKFSNYDIYDAMNRELLALSSPINGLYQVVDYELTYNPVISGYDFPYEILDVFQVRYTTPGAHNEWFISQDWEFSRNAGDAFASDKALFIRDAFPNQSVVVKAKVPFNVLPTDINGDVITTSGLPYTCLDILAIGAAYILASSREVKRNFDESQGDTRRAQEVPPGANLGASRELARLRQQRINEEASRLNLLYPVRSPRYPYVVGG